MKKIILFSILNLFITIGLFAANYNVTISGYSYSPATLTVNVGDNITLSASSMHPLVQVDKATWMASGSTPKSGGWGTKTTDYTLTTSVADTIYYVCSAHVSFGMKGQIIVNTTASINTSNSFKFDFSIYPNPVSKNAYLTINISENKDFSVHIYNMVGKEISNKKYTNNNSSASLNISIDVSELTNGIYFVGIKTDDKFYTKRMLVTK